VREALGETAGPAEQAPSRSRAARTARGPASRLEQPRGAPGWGPPSPAVVELRGQMLRMPACSTARPGGQNTRKPIADRDPVVGEESTTAARPPPARAPGAGNIGLIGRGVGRLVAVDQRLGLGGRRGTGETRAGPASGRERAVRLGRAVRGDRGSPRARLTDTCCAADPGTSSDRRAKRRERSAVPAG